MIDRRKQELSRDREGMVQARALKAEMKQQEQLIEKEEAKLRANEANIKIQEKRVLAVEEAGIHKERKIEIEQSLNKQREEKERKMTVKMAEIDRQHKETVA